MMHALGGFALVDCEALAFCFVLFVCLFVRLMFWSDGTELFLHTGSPFLGREVAADRFVF